MKKLLALILSVILLVACLPTATVFAAERRGSSAETAITASIGTKYNFSWTNQNNSDPDLWVKVTLAKRGILTFNGSKLMDAMGEEDYVTFNLFKSSDTSTPIWKTSNSRYKMQSAYKINIPLDAGTYYFAITGMWLSSSDGTRNFTYSFNFSANSKYETEPNSNINTADKLTFENRVYGYNSNDDDVYKITVTKDTPARVKFGNLAVVDEAASVKFTDAGNKSEYISAGQYGATKKSDYHYYDVLLKKGTNTITVGSNYNSDYKYWIEVSKDISVGTPKITSIKKDGTDLTVTWGKVSGADGYEILRKINNESWKSVGTTTSTGFQQWFSDFSKSYQFKIRSYVQVGTYDSAVKVYSNWSTIKAIIPTPTNIKLSKTEMTYNGKAQKPTVKIKDVNGKTLKAGTDYTVKYSSGRKTVGKYKVTITFKGSYTGKVTKYFKIVPKTTSVTKVSGGKKSLTVKYKKQSSQTSGYQIQYATSKNFKSGAKLLNVNKTSATSKSIKGLKAKKTYYVRVRTYKIIKGTKYYSGWSTAKKVKTK